MGVRVDPDITIEIDAGLYAGTEAVVGLGMTLDDYAAFNLADDLRGQWAVFVKFLRSWNLEDAAGPIPPDEDALSRVPPPVARALLSAWQQAAVNPPSPLPSTSSEPVT